MIFENQIASLRIYLSTEDLYTVKMKAKGLADELFNDNLTFSLAQKTFSHLDNTMCELMLDKHKHSLYLLQAFVVYFYQYIGHNIHSVKNNWLELKDESLFEGTSERILTNQSRENIFLGIIKPEIFNQGYSYSMAFRKNYPYLQTQFNVIKQINDNKMESFELFKLHTYRQALGENYLLSDYLLKELNIHPKKTQEQIGIWREKQFMESMLNGEDSVNQSQCDGVEFKVNKKKL